MAEQKSSSLPILLGFVLVASVFGAGGYFLAQQGDDENEPEKTLTAAEEQSVPVPEKKPTPLASKPAPSETIFDDDDKGEERGRRGGPWGWGNNQDLSEEDRKAMEERAKRWEAMPREQRQMVQRAWMKAAANHLADFEQIGEAVRNGELDQGVMKEIMNPQRFMEQMDEVEVLSDFGNEEEVQKTIGKSMKETIDAALSQRKPAGTPSPE